MKILITGATGFIGNNVLKKIVVKYSPEKVIALSSQNIAGIKTIPSKGYDFDKNYLKENGCYDVEVLMHIGSFIPKSLAHVDNMEETTMNIVNTQNLLKSDLPFLKKIVFISTIDVYAHISEPLTELTDTNPSGLYGWSKLYCEQLVLKHCIKNHLDYEILRLGHVYGEGEEKYQKAMPIMIKRAIEGKNLNIYGDGEAIRSFIYIADVAKAIVTAIELDESEVINIVGDESVTINRLAEMIRSFASEKVDIIHIPTDVPNVDFIFDNTKLKKYLIDELTPLYVGLKREYDYMKERLT